MGREKKKKTQESGSPIVHMFCNGKSFNFKGAVLEMVQAQLKGGLLMYPMGSQNHGLLQ